MEALHQRFIEHRIAEPDRPRYLYEYYVTGRGMFPYDMLRYDQCWPVDGEAAAKIPVDTPYGTRGIRSIKMRSNKEPTVARWSSFLWSVGLTNINELK